MEDAKFKSWPGPKEVGDAMGGLHPQTVIRMCDAGLLKFEDVGAGPLRRRFKIDPESVKNFKKTRKKK